MKPRSTLLSGAFSYLSQLGGIRLMGYHLKESTEHFQQKA